MTERPPIEVLAPDPLNPSVLRPLQPAPVLRPSFAFMASHPAHAIALGFGAGLARHAPGTVGTLWAWAAFAVMQPWLSDTGWALVIGLNLLLGWWACTVTSTHLGQADCGNIVWDEVAAFWLVLWLVLPAGFWAQLAAFGLFRVFDAVKRGPVGWADAAFHGKGARGGFGIMFDDLVAAFCTLLVVAAWRFIWP